MNLRKIAGTATMAGAMAAVALGMGAGNAQADHDWPGPPNIPGPDWDDFNGVPPGHIGQLVGEPPGQLKKDPIPGNPFYGVPPGHWDDALQAWVHWDDDLQAWVP